MTTPTGTKDLSTVLRQVRKLVDFAESEYHNDPGLSEDANKAAKLGLIAQQDAARTKADALMLDYAITSAQIRDAAPAGTKPTPKTIEVSVGGAARTEADGVISRLLDIVAGHCRVSVRTYSRYDKDSKQWMAKVYGWSGDVEYFEFLYTTLRLHMLGALAPRWDAALTMEENAYRMHEAGYSWLEMAAMRGWRKTESWEIPEGWDRSKLGDHFHNLALGEAAGYWALAGMFKKAYQRACRARNETPTKTVGGKAAKYYRTDAASGYVSRISQRLNALKKAQDVSQAGAVVLARSAQDLEDYVREQNPSDYTRCPACEKLSGNPYTCDRCGEKIADEPEYPQCPKCAKNPSGTCRDHPGGRMGRMRNFSEAGYSAGVARANTADLGGGVSGGSRTAVGS